jgi:hypothetical protein
MPPALFFIFEAGSVSLSYQGWPQSSCFHLLGFCTTIQHHAHLITFFFFGSPLRFELRALWLLGRHLPLEPNPHLLFAVFFFFFFFWGGGHTGA